MSTFSDMIFRKKLLSQTITELKSDLASVKDLIREWNSICETGSVAQRMRFTMVDVGKLKDLNLKLRNHDSRIDSILQTLQSAANDHISEQNKKLQQQLEDMNRIIKKIERQTRKRQKWEEVVTQHGVAAVSQAACDQDEKPWLLIKKDLVKKGLSEEEADEILKPIRSELSELPAPEPVLHSPDPKTPPERMTSPVIIPIHPKKPPKVKEPDLAPPSPLPEANPPNGSSQESVTIRATTKRKAQVIDVNRSRILFADESNTRKCSDRRLHSSRYPPRRSCTVLQLLPPKRMREHLTFIPNAMHRDLDRPAYGCNYMLWNIHKYFLIT